MLLLDKPDIGKHKEKPPMTDHVYKTIELTGSSSTGIEDAVNTAVAKAAQSIHKLRWFEVTQIRGEIADSTVRHWQVTAKVGFTIDE
jgi:flavin-binding protein dodecin